MPPTACMVVDFCQLRCQISSVPLPGPAPASFALGVRFHLSSAKIKCGITLTAGWVRTLCSRVLRRTVRPCVHRLCGHNQARKSSPGDHGTRSPRAQAGGRAEAYRASPYEPRRTGTCLRSWRLCLLPASPWHGPATWVGGFRRRRRRRPPRPRRAPRAATHVCGHAQEPCRGVSGGAEAREASGSRAGDGRRTGGGRAHCRAATGSRVGGLREGAFCCGRGACGAGGVCAGACIRGTAPPGACRARESAHREHNRVCSGRTRRMLCPQSGREHCAVLRETHTGADPVAAARDPRGPRHIPAAARGRSSHASRAAPGCQ